MDFWNVAKLNLVFDLDNTLVFYTPGFCSPKVNQYFFQYNENAVTFIEGLYYYILPGAIELLHYLFFHPDIRVSFFSAGTKERNEMLINYLILLAVGNDRFRDVKKKVTCFSRDDLTYSEKPATTKNINQNSFFLPGFATHPTLKEEDIILQAAHFKFNYCRYKKDLRKTLLSYDNIENYILVDDRADVVFPGQEKLFLNAIHVEAKDFENFLNYNYGDEQDSFLDDDMFLTDLETQNINSIFYLAGVIKNCIKNHSENTLKNYLFDLQFIKSSHKTNHYEPIFFEPQSNQEYYDCGLATLRVFNPALDFSLKSAYQKKTGVASTL